MIVWYHPCCRVAKLNQDLHCSFFSFSGPADYGSVSALRASLSPSILAMSTTAGECLPGCGHVGGNEGRGLLQQDRVPKNVRFEGPG